MIISPNIPVVADRIDINHRGIRTVRVSCPFCCRVHSHGWPSSDLQPGHRRAHCLAGTYTITIRRRRRR